MLKNVNGFIVLRLFSIFFLAVTMGGCAVCPCKNLKKVTSQDDLFGQIYETALKDSCLFKMTAEELQNVWEIPVIEFTNVDEYNENIKNNKFYINEELNSPIGLFVERHLYMNTHDFIVHMTDSYKNEYMTLFPEGVLPKSLPKVIKLKDMSPPRHNPDFKPDKIIIDRDQYDFFQSGYYYYWKGTTWKKSRMVFVVVGGVIREVIVSNAKDSLLEELK